MLRVEAVKKLNALRESGWLGLESLLPGEIRAIVSMMEEKILFREEKLRLLRKQVEILQQKGRGGETLPIIRRIDAIRGEKETYEGEVALVRGACKHKSFEEDEEDPTILRCKTCHIVRVGSLSGR